MITTPFVIRPATEADQATIVALIRAARLNPRNLDWSRFLVAEDGGKVVGVRQVRVHKEGTREVGSGYVLPEYRRQGISTRLMERILARERGPLYLLCNQKWTGYYERFGFRQVAPASLPTDIRREYWIGRTVTTLLTLFSRDRVRIVPMKRDGEG